MKKVYVFFRVLNFKDGTQHRMPGGVFTDKEDAIREGKKFAESMSGLHQAVAAAFGYVGIVGVSGVVVEQSLVAGAGLIVPSDDRVVIPPIGQP